MRLDLPRRMVDRLEFEAATRDEAERPIDFLPSRVVERAVAEHAAEFAGIVGAQCEAGLDVEPQETVWAPKPGAVGRYRPITTLPLRERVLLRALTNELAGEASAFDRGAEAQQAFQRRALENGSDYIVVADVASFYFFIDHELLQSRIVEATARADTAESIQFVLDVLLGRAYGLPQNFGPSELLSEFFISPVERRLIRAGIRTFRNNDDFRLGAPTWGQALQALERLQEEVSGIGLDLNGEKSWILKRERYEQNLTIAERLFEAAFEEVQGDFVPVHPYTGEPLDDQEGAVPEEEETTQAVKIAFEAAAARRRDTETPMNGFESRANRQIISTAIAYLIRAGDDGAVEEGPHLLALDPLLARQYALYLKALSAIQDGPVTSERVSAALAAFRGHAPHWTQAWLMDALLRPTVQLSNDITEWLRTFLAGPAPSILRVRAALVLAIHGELDKHAIASLFDELPIAARPDAAAALAFVAPVGDEVVDAITASSRLHRWAFEHASENRDDPTGL